jgi:uncharacterized membrane protein YeiH
MGLRRLNISREMATAIAIGIGFVVRLIAIRYSLALPVPEIDAQ